MIKKFLGLIVILLIIFTAGITVAESRTPLADGVLRLHVIANSDDPADQALKLQVKDEIVKMMREEFTGTNNAEEARQTAIKRLPEIKRTAEAVVAREGYSYPVNVYVGEYRFPTKAYGNLVLPQGEYQAVRVVIGTGQGKNWWCVLFPPLCLVSSSDKGISLANPRVAKVSLKCLELIPRGAKLVRK
ncbi:MAG: stage II sporulation protein R [Syntrophomonadaceae bacterium]|jgi:stage II sporulation protein R